MNLARKYWGCCVLFVGVQVMMVYAVIYRENNYIAHFYKLQKLEQLQAQLVSEYNALQNELQKNKGLEELKEYASESLHLQQLPLSAFRSLYDNDTV